MSHIPAQSNHSTYFPAVVLSPAPVTTIGSGYTSSSWFPIEPGTKFVNIVLDITSNATESFEIRMAHSLELEPNTSTQIDFIRKELYVVGPPSYYDQEVYKLRFVGVVASPAGKALIVAIPLTNFSSKWGRIDVAATNTAATNVGVTVIQGR